MIRSNDVRRVTHKGTSKLLKEVEERLPKELKYVREIEHRGKKAWQYAAETTVILEQRGRIKQATASNPNKRKL